MRGVVQTESFASQCVSVSETILGFRLNIFRFGLIMAVTVVLVMMGKRKMLTWGLLLLAVSRFLAGLSRS